MRKKIGKIILSLLIALIMLTQAAPLIAANSFNAYSFNYGRDFTTAASGTNLGGLSGNQAVGNLDPVSGVSKWLLFTDVDFGQKGSQNLSISGVNGSSSGAAANIQVREGSSTGTLLGTVSFAAHQSGWTVTSYNLQTFTPTGALLGLTGLHDICFVFVNGSIYFHGWQFTEMSAPVRDPYAVNPASGADSISAAATGFQKFDFGSAGSRKIIINGSATGAPAPVEVREGSAAGAVLATLNFPATGSQARGLVFNLPGAALTGEHDIFFTYPSDSFTLQSVQFIGVRPNPVSAYQVIQAEDFDANAAEYTISNYTDDASEVQAAVIVTDNGGSFTYNGVDFGSVGSAKIRIYGYANSARALTLSAGGVSFSLRGTYPGYNMMEFDAAGITGIHDLVISYEPGGGEFGIDWFTFVQMSSGIERERSELFNDGWKFYYQSSNLAVGTTSSSPTQLSYNDAAWREVDLPHDWVTESFTNQTISTLLSTTNYGWYRKAFYLPEDLRGKNITVRFEGIYMDSYIYLNGTQVANRPYGYSTFEVDLTNNLNYGNTPNIMAVNVRYVTPNSRWGTGAGIYRNVWLTVTEPVKVAFNGTYISTDGAGGNVIIDTEVKNTSSASASNVVVTQEILGAGGALVSTATAAPVTVGAGATVKVTQNMTVANPAIWSLEERNLYTMKTTVKVAGAVSDEYLTSFGFRTILFDSNNGFFLNGKHVKLQGVAEHHDLGALGAAMNYRAMERKMEILKAMGVNCIRTAHNPPSVEMMELADKMGFLIINEAFDVWGSASKNSNDYARFWTTAATDGSGKQWHEVDTRDWVRRDRNHPSNIMWSIGNEIGTTASATVPASGKTNAQNLCNYVRNEDSRGNGATTIASNAPASPGVQDIVGTVTGSLGFNYIDSAVDALHASRPNVFIYGAETTGGHRSRGIFRSPPTLTAQTWLDFQCSSFDNNRMGYGKSCEDAWIFARDRDYIGGDVIWSGFDYLGEPTPYGGSAKNSYFGIIDTAGLPKEAYYFYQSVWTDEPMIKLIPYWDENYQYYDEGAGGYVVPVWAYSNCDSVELFLDGVSLGKQTIDLLRGKVLHAEWKIPYNPGTLIAKGYDAGGSVLVTDSIYTSKDGVAVDLKLDRATITADGKDLIFVEANVLDSDGRFVPDARNRIEFKVTGAGKLFRTDNGNGMDLESYLAASRKLFSGKVIAIIQSDGTAGPITIEAASPGLAPKTVTANAVHKQAATGVVLDSINGATAITASGGTLKMAGQVLPVNADYKKVAYSVSEINGDATDKAVISKSGVLRAFKNGSVRVTATAMDGSGLSSSAVITISGQGAVTNVTGITVTGASNATAITTKTGTLQMSAAITPTGAAATDVVWSVVNKDGSLPVCATIGANANKGLLRAEYNGVVTVRATALDGSSVYGERDITISNQHSTYIGARRIGLEVAGGSHELDMVNKVATVKATVYPAGAALSEVDWRIVEDPEYSAASLAASIVEINRTAGTCTIVANYDGRFAVVATTRNSSNNIEVYAPIHFSATGISDESINPYELVAATRYGAKSDNASLEGDRINLRAANSYATFNTMDFSLWGSNRITVTGANGSGSNAVIQVRENTPDGTLVGTINFAATGGWDAFSSQQFTFTTANTLYNTRNLCFVVTSGNFILDSFIFTENARTNMRNPYVTIEGGSADTRSGGCSVSGTSPYRYAGLTGVNYNQWLRYNYFDFGPAGTRRAVVAAAGQRGSYYESRLEIRNDNSLGKTYIEGRVPQTGTNTNWTWFTLDTLEISGARNICLGLPDGVVNVMQFLFVPRRLPGSSAFKRIEAETYDSGQGVFNIMPIDTVNQNNRPVGRMPVAAGTARTELAVTNISGDNEELMFKGLDFGPEGAAIVRIRGKLDTTTIGARRQITIGQYLSDGSGVRLTDCQFERPAAVDSFGYSIQEFEIVNNIKGLNDIYLTFMPGYNFNIDWIQFVPVVEFSAESLAGAAGGSLNVKVTVPERMKAPGKTADAYLALYDKDHRLVSLAVYADVDRGNYYFDIPADTTDMTFKVFLWDSGYVPLMSPVSLN